jgi:hypothetical protein
MNQKLFLVPNKKLSKEKNPRGNKGETQGTVFLFSFDRPFFPLFFFSFYYPQMTTHEAVSFNATETHEAVSFKFQCNGSMFASY